MVTPTVISALLSFAPDNFAPPYEFDPVTADLDVDDDGALEVLAVDATLHTYCECLPLLGCDPCN